MSIDENGWTLTERFRSSQGAIAFDLIGEGDGDPIVLVHGTPASSFLWRRIAPALAERRPVLVYDMPGFGQSDKYEGQDLRLRSFANVLAQLLDHLGLENAALVGHDFGAATVMGAHLIEGYAASRIVVIDGVLLSPWGTAFSRGVKDHLDVFQSLPGYVHEAMVRAHIATAMKTIMPQTTLDRLTMPWLGKDGQQAYYRKISQYDYEYTELLERKYGEIGVPVDIIWGEEDEWVPVAEAHRMKDLIPHAELHLLPDAGHFSMEDLPNAMTRKLRSLLGG